jgi:hypothetical protein
VPIVQFAEESIRDNDGDLYKTMTESKLLKGLPADRGQGDARLHRPGAPDLLKEGRRAPLLPRHDAAEDGGGGAGLDEVASQPASAGPGSARGELLYRFAKKHWFFGFGAYT